MAGLKFGMDNYDGVPGVIPAPEYGDAFPNVIPPAEFYSLQPPKTAPALEVTLTSEVVGCLYVLAQVPHRVYVCAGQQCNQVSSGRWA